jgi:hypothetical protein
MRVRVDDEEDAGQGDRHRDQHFRADALVKKEHREQSAEHGRRVVEQSGHADADLRDGDEIQQYGQAAEEAAVEKQIETLKREGAAPEPRDEERRRQSRCEPDERHLGTGDLRGRELGRERHGSEEHGRAHHEEECAAGLVWYRQRAEIMYDGHAIQGCNGFGRAGDHRVPAGHGS